MLKNLTARRLYAGIFLVVFVGYVSMAFVLGTLTAPPELGDGQDYDAIAFNLWQHRGFGFDWDNAEWREPYLSFARYKPVLDRHSDFRLTAYRPPAMPYLLAFVYSVAGRNFVAWRIVNCAIMAGAVTLVAAISARFAGPVAAVLTATLSLLNPSLVASSQRFLTEALACFFVALLAWTWLARDGKTRPLPHAAKLGFILGLLVAARSIFLLWGPLVLLVRGWRPKTAFLVAFFAIIGPWWMRNVVVTRSFMPFGTEGAINLPAGFGPRALKAQGLWVPNTEDGAPELASQNLDPLEYEVRLAKYRSALTLKWMSQHPIDVVRLMFLHVWQELRPRGVRFSDWLLLMAIVAAVVLRKSPGIGMLVLFISITIFSVALTWSVEGRFMVPVHPLMIALVGAMGAQLVHRKALHEGAERHGV